MNDCKALLARFSAKSAKSRPIGGPTSMVFVGLPPERLRKWVSIFFISIFLSPGLSGCGGDNGDSGNANTDADIDVNTDADIDAETDTDTDTEEPADCTHYLSTRGSDSNPGASVDNAWGTLEYACNHIQAGDVLCVMDDGIYNEHHCTLSNSGTADSPITIRAYSGKWTLDGIDETGTCIEIHGKSHISISDFRIKNYNTGIMGDDLIRHLTISDFTIEDVSTQAIAFDDASLQDSEITDFTIQNTGGISIRRLGWTDTDCHDVTISHFIIRNSANNGIQWRNSQRIHIKHGEIHDAGADGIELLTSVDDSIMEDIKVYNAGWHGLGITDGTSPCYRNTIKDCYIAYAGHNAIDIHTDAYDTLVENCEITGDSSMGAGIFFHNGGEGLTVRNCTIYGASTSTGDTFFGIQTGRPDVLVEDCTLYNLTNAIYTDPGHSDDIVIRNNVIYSTTYDNAMHIATLNNALIESNTIGESETYRIDVGSGGIIRNGLDDTYFVYSEYGSTITVEYNNGKTFSVDGSGNYTTYTFSSGFTRIDVL